MPHHQTIAYKRGFCDAIMGREADGPTSWPQAAHYLRGYLDGKAMGVVWYGAKLEEKVA